MISRAPALTGWQPPGLLAGAILEVLPSGVAVGARRSDLVAHRATWGTDLSDAGDRGLLDDISAISLTGRGGGHFPTARKDMAALDCGPGGTVVVNAAEGEPASAKDAAVWQSQPHLVLDGAVAIARVIGAREIVVWVHSDSLATRRSMDQAIAERGSAGLKEPPMRMLLAPEGYVSGESSAVIAGVRGLPVAPTFVVDPARPWGDGPPILVHNTETVARIGMLAHTGVAGYPSTSLITVATPVVPGRIYERIVVELPASGTIADALSSVGCIGADYVLLGGFAGSWHLVEEVLDISLDPIVAAEQGLSLGAGVVIPLSGEQALRGELAAITEFLAESSARQCGPCKFGLPELARTVRRGRFDQVDDLATLISGRGGCRMPDGAVRMLRSAMALLDRIPVGHSGRTGES